MNKEKADYLLCSDYIFTATDAEPFQGFVAVKGNQIMKVEHGTNFENLIDAHTTVLNLKEKLVTPGFIDVHTFFTGFSIFHIGTDLSKVKTETECLDCIAAEAKQKEQNKTIFGHGWKPEQFPANGFEDKLTAIYPEQCVVLFSADRGSCLLNKKAKEKFGFTTECCYPEAYHKIMPEYLNDRVFIEPEFKRYMGMMNRRGVTTVKEMGFDDFYGFDDFLKEKEDKKELTLRTFFMSQPVGERINLEHGKKMREKFQGDFVRFSGYNCMTDGTVASGRADLLQPYEGTNTHCGMEIDYDLIEKEVQMADENGFRYSLHAQGDGAVHKVMQIFDACKKENGKLVNRHAVTDMEFTNPLDLQKMGEMGVIGEIYFQIMSFDAGDEVKASIKKMIGEERGKYFWNRRCMQNAGMVLSGATDLPLMITDIPEAIYHSCGGYFPDKEETFNTQNTITISEILKAWTYGGAYNIGMEEKLGTLEEGKLADITVLNRNVFAVPMREMRDVKVELTMSDGKIVYQA